MNVEQKPKIILITGANKGLGFGILKLLAQKDSSKYTFIIGVRSIEKGEKALEDLSKDAPGVQNRAKVKDLDITDAKSIDSFVKWIKETYGTIDCLVNNAGISSNKEFGAEAVEETFATNVHGTIRLTEKLLPYISQKGKIVSIGSHVGTLANLKSESLINELNAPEITVEKLKELIHRFETAVKNGTSAEEGWVDSAYKASKVFVNVYAQALSNLPEVTEKQIQCYSCTPGWVRTDIGGLKGERSIEEGAVCPAWLVQLPWEVIPGYQGKFFRDCQVVPLTKSSK